MRSPVIKRKLCHRRDVPHRKESAFTLVESSVKALVEFLSRDSRVSWKSLHFVRSRSGATPYGCGVAVDQLNPLRALNFIEKGLGILLLASTRYPPGIITFAPDTKGDSSLCCFPPRYDGPKKHEKSVPIPANRLASKTPFSTLYSP